MGLLVKGIGGVFFRKIIEWAGVRHNTLRLGVDFGKIGSNGHKMG